MPFLEVQNLGFSYPGGPPVLENISFKIDAGSHVAIAGGNGSGKSTLVRLLAGLWEPGEGEVLWKAGSSLPAGLVYQNPAHQIVATVVREDTAFGPENLGLPSGEIQSRVEEALQAVSLLPLAARGTHQLSAGQQQRLALAGILALQPGCLILDEADSMLNPRGRRRLDRLLKDFLEQGYTIIRVTHDMEQAAGADRLLILHQGRLVRDGGPEILAEENLEQWHLKAPPVLALERKIADWGLSFSCSFPGTKPWRACSGEEELAAALGKSISVRDSGPGGQFPGLWRPPDVKASAFFREPEGEPILELKGVSCFYGQKGSSSIKALEDISFSLCRGEAVVVAGLTGSGKSTFLQVLNSLLLPRKGHIRIFGLDPLNRKTDLSSLRTRAALVMQQPEKQLFAPLVGDDVAFGPRMAGLKGRELSLRVREAMESAGLPFREFRDRPVKTLSGGQKRRAALAGILALKPELLLLDEPTAGLDPAGAQDMNRLLLALQERGLAQVIVSHSMEQALTLARRFVLLDQGRMVYDGSGEAFFREGNPEALGLEYPLSARLALKLGCPREVLPVTEEQFLMALRQAVPPGEISKEFSPQFYSLDKGNKE